MQMDYATCLPVITKLSRLLMTPRYDISVYCKQFRINLIVSIIVQCGVYIIILAHCKRFSAHLAELVVCNRPKPVRLCVYVCVLTWVAHNTAAMVHFGTYNPVWGDPPAHPEQFSQTFTEIFPSDKFPQKI